MKMNKLIKASFLILCFSVLSTGFTQSLSVDQMKFLTHQWEGERFEDGRPKVPTDILERMKKVTIEEAWGVLRNEVPVWLEEAPLAGLILSVKKANPKHGGGGALYVYLRKNKSTLG